MRFTFVGALCALIFATPSHASDRFVDSASLELGGTSQGRMVRVGVQKHLEKRWFQSNGTHVAAYWDASLARWRGDAHRNVKGQHQDITSIGLTPVFRLRADDLKGWFVEGGIGVHLLSELYNNGPRELSTAFQFGDHIGAGYVFENGWEATAKFQHFSNGGIKRPNDGVNFVLFSLAKPF
jgi:lipid A 3-O-deacylase